MRFIFFRSYRSLNGEFVICSRTNPEDLFTNVPIGVVNHPDAGKYQYWTGGKPVGNFEEWIARATENPGSWWPHWQKWIEDKNDTRVAARKPGKKTKILGDAPGDYVKVRV